jgi:hypothetical protein
MRRNLSAARCIRLAWKARDFTELVPRNCSGKIGGSKSVAEGEGAIALLDCVKPFRFVFDLVQVTWIYQETKTFVP